MATAGTRGALGPLKAVPGHRSHGSPAQGGDPHRGRGVEISSARTADGDPPRHAHAPAKLRRFRRFTRNTIGTSVLGGRWGLSD